MTTNKPCVLGAGPMALHPEVSLAMAKPLAHHMTPYVRGIYAETLERLQRVFGTRNDMLMYPCSGTGIVEAAVQNLLAPGDSVVVTNGGTYGERFKRSCVALGVDAIDIKLAHGEPATPGAVLKALDKYPEARTVAIIHVETSTGAISPLEEIAKAVKAFDREILVLVDAVASMGGVEVKADDWGLDVVVAASQKALMAAPGVGIVSVGELGWRRIAENPPRGFYFDFAFARNEFANNRYPVTPPVTAIYGLHKALEIMESAGLANVYANCRACRDHLLSALPALGYRLMARPGYEADTLTAAYVPEGRSALAIMDRLQSEHNITICTGIGENLDKAVRIGHMGYTSVDDVMRLTDALSLM